MQRREFLGLGLFVFVQEPGRLPRRAGGYPSDLNAYLRIGEDGNVTCLVGKVELGQGSMTSLAQVLAEELDVPFDRVNMRMGDTDVCPWDVGTFGSLCTPLLVPVVRQAGAEARAVLLQMAAERLKVPRDRLKVSQGVISGGGGSVSYARLVEGKRIERHLDKAPVKPVKEFQVIGTSPRRKDARAKVTGQARFAGDLILPGMLHARLVRPPAHGARLKSVDTSEAEKVARVVRDGDLVAVLHERPDVAAEAVALVKADFEMPPAGPDDRSIFDHLLKTAPAPQVVAESGNLAEGERLAAGVVEQTYLNSYVAHATIETHSATAQFQDGKLTVWASTQAPFIVKSSLVESLGLDPGKVRVISHYVGGGFGGKTQAEQGIEAARLARLTGRPVQVVWNRREEFFYDRFRPAAVIKIRSGLTAAGTIAFWDSQIYGGGDREAKPFYDIPHQRTVSAGGWGGGNPPGMNPFNVGPWRAPSVNSNTFARESHLDILAGKAGLDPVQFRLDNLKDARMRRTLEAAARRFGWKAGRGRGWGVACGYYSNACNATIAEVTVDSGKVRVKRVVLALDVGVMLNPDGLRQQAEGSITMGLGYCLSEEVRFRGGEVLTRSFDSYEIPRFSWLPRIDVVLVENPDTPALGAGEPPIICMGAALANAIYDAVGVRVTQLPMTPERIVKKG